MGKAAVDGLFERGNMIRHFLCRIFRKKCLERLSRHIGVCGRKIKETANVMFLLKFFILVFSSYVG